MSVSKERVHEPIGWAITAAGRPLSRLLPAFDSSSVSSVEIILKGLIAGHIFSWVRGSYRKVFLLTFHVSNLFSVLLADSQFLRHVVANLYIKLTTGPLLMGKGGGGGFERERDIKDSSSG